MPYCTTLPRCGFFGSSSGRVRRRFFSRVVSAVGVGHAVENFHVDRRAVELLHRNGHVPRMVQQLTIVLRHLLGSDPRETPQLRRRFDVD